MENCDRSSAAAIPEGQQPITPQQEFGGGGQMLLAQEDALKLLIRLLRQPHHGDYGSYGYEIYLPALLRHHLETQGILRFDQDKHLRGMMPTFYDAA
jgi:hypothetical protein